MAKSKLTDKQRAFIREYPIDNNATQAAIRAGYAKSSARQRGSELVSNRDIMSRIEKKFQKAAEKADLTVEWCTKRLMMLADSDIGSFVNINPNGVSLKDVDSLTKDERYALQEVSENIKIDGGGSQKVKIHDKAKALEVLLRHLGGFDKDKLTVESPTFVIERPDGTKVRLGMGSEEQND